MEASILKDGIEAIANLAREAASRNIITRTYFGREYYMNRDRRLVPVAPPEIHLPVARTLYSLDALSAMIRREGADMTFPLEHSADSDYGDDTLFVMVKSPVEVVCSTSMLTMPDYQRCDLYVAKCAMTYQFQTGRKYSHETMMIMLRSQFQPSEDREYLLKLLSSVTSEATVKSEDNGLGQQVSVNKGIRNIQMEPVKSIVSLRPYRTFHEIEQPESEFLVRLSVEEDGGVSIALHEADGGMWQMDARRKIAAYLEQQLREEVSRGDVVVTA